MNKVKADKGRDDLSNYQVKKLPPTGVIPLILNAGQDLRQKTFEVNRDFFRNKVLTSKNRGGYTYLRFILTESRGAGTIDAYANAWRRRK